MGKDIDKNVNDDSVDDQKYDIYPLLPLEDIKNRELKKIALQIPATVVTSIGVLLFVLSVVAGITLLFATGYNSYIEPFKENFDIPFDIIDPPFKVDQFATSLMMSAVALMGGGKLRNKARSAVEIESVSLSGEVGRITEKVIDSIGELPRNDENIDRADEIISFAIKLDALQNKLGDQPNQVEGVGLSIWEANNEALQKGIDYLKEQDRAIGEEVAAQKDDKDLLDQTYRVTDTDVIDLAADVMRSINKKDGSESKPSQSDLRDEIKAIENRATEISEQRREE